MSNFPSVAIHWHRYCHCIVRFVYVCAILCGRARTITHSMHKFPMSICMSWVWHAATMRHCLGIVHSTMEHREFKLLFLMSWSHGRRADTRDILRADVQTTLCSLRVMPDFICTFIHLWFGIHLELGVCVCSAPSFLIEIAPSSYDCIAATKKQVTIRCKQTDANAPIRPTHQL